MIDTVATVVLSLLALGAAGVALFSSPFLVMATDSAGGKPNLKPLGWAYAVIGTAVLAVIVVGYAPGVFLATTVIPKDR